jgi:hypothetical protein
MCFGKDDDIRVVCQGAISSDDAKLLKCGPVVEQTEIRWPDK